MKYEFKIFGRVLSFFSDVLQADLLVRHASSTIMETEELMTQTRACLRQYGTHTKHLGGIWHMSDLAVVTNVIQRRCKAGTFFSLSCQNQMLEEAL